MEPKEGSFPAKKGYFRVKSPTFEMTFDCDLDKKRVNNQEQIRVGFSWKSLLLVYKMNWFKNVSWGKSGQ